jgi:hypothetical protein
MRQNPPIARRPWLARDPRSEHVRRLIAGATRRLTSNGKDERRSIHPLERTTVSHKSFDRLSP